MNRYEELEGKELEEYIERRRRQRMQKRRKERQRRRRIAIFSAFSIVVLVVVLAGTLISKIFFSGSDKESEIVGNKVGAETQTDHEAPVISGVVPLEMFIGDTVSYKSGITVTDNRDDKVKLQVDNSEVDTDKEGTYVVRYSATDKAGNTATKETTLTVKAKPQDYVEPDEVYALADKVLDEITTKDMNVKEKARAIYDWTKTNISYVDTSDKSSWTNGAEQGFNQRSGDCFVYYSVAKALLTRAEISNIDVVKSDTSHSRHYWSLANCGDGWYHFDATPRKGGGEFFMLTDAQLEEYSVANDNSHIFDTSLYPSTPKTEFTMD